LVVIDENAKHLQVLSIDLPIWQNFHIILEFEAVLQELPLLPLDVLVENFENVLEIQRKHEDAKRIVFDCEAIS
jgi:hypothetical protein